MSGWQQPTPPDRADGPTHWSRKTVDPFGPGQLLRRGWRLYRSMPGRLLSIALIVGAVQAVLVIPTLAPTVALVQGMFDVLADYFEKVMANPEAYRFADQRALQAELETQLRAVLVPVNDFAVLGGVSAGVGVAVGLFGTAALSAMALSIAAGRPVPVPFAFRLVAARGGLVKPILAIGLGWIAVSLVSLGLQGSPEIQAWAGATGSPRSELIGGLLGLLGVVVAVAIVVLAVRWALFMPVVLVEALGVGPGLGRAAQLTHGIRGRLALAMAGALIVAALVGSVVASVVGLALGLAAGSVAVGFAAYLVASLVVSALWAPWLPAVLAVAYRERTTPAGAADQRSGALAGDAAYTDGPDGGAS